MSVAKADDTSASPADLICGCTGLTRPDLEALLAADPGIDFERMQGATGAGLRCTACMLDLEYHFVSIDRGKPAKPGQQLRVPAASERRPLKRRLYDFIDRLAPQVPVRLDNVLPVLKGRGIEQFIIVANQPMLNGTGECAPDMGVVLTVRDCNGAEVFRESHIVGAEQVFRTEVSRHLPPPADGEPLGIGSVQVVRRASGIGYRGTTRPQTEIVASAGHCAVHGQAAHGAGGGGFTCRHRPESERVFVSFVSSDRHAGHIDMAITGMEDTGTPGASRRIALPSMGARLMEATLPADESTRLNGRLIDLSWRVDRRFKAHVWCASRQIDRISLDHV